MPSKFAETTRRRSASGGGRSLLSGWVDRADNKTSSVIYAIGDEPLTEEEWAATYYSKD